MNLVSLGPTGFQNLVRRLKLNPGDIEHTVATPKRVSDLYVFDNLRPNLFSAPPPPVWSILRALYEKK